MSIGFIPSLIVIPGSPAVVTELAPADSAAAQVREHVASLLDDRPREVIGSSDPRWKTSLEGSFKAWGADVNVGAGTDLAELVARYLVDEIASFRDSIGEINPKALTVVVVDGPAGLTARAPLSLIPEAPQTHEKFQQLLVGANVQITHAELESAGVVEPQLWLELARLQPTKAELLFADDSLGVGRYVAAWELQGELS
ncbi:hypothetical protein [Corynebacterium lubricantis]|uniref:hypothetical protein n=1 Tax=Corynebacterium lubricantis TaxID=541095 RepID=UPI0003A6FD48|nr:hypothetical protein [Corynebacterium lubricantis]